MCECVLNEMWTLRMCQDLVFGLTLQHSTVCSVSIQVNDRPQVETVEHKHEEIYFDSDRFVHGNGTKVVIEGPQSYPVSFALPHAIPSSYEGDFGHVRYVVSTTLSK